MYKGAGLWRSYLVKIAHLDLFELHEVSGVLCNQPRDSVNQHRCRDVSVVNASTRQFAGSCQITEAMGNRLGLVTEYERRTGEDLNVAQSFLCFQSQAVGIHGSGCDDQVLSYYLPTQRQLETPVTCLDQEIPCSLVLRPGSVGGRQEHIRVRKQDLTDRRHRKCRDATTRAWTPWCLR